MERKIACITGASRGIGLALVKEYLEQGHRVVAVSRNADRIEANPEYENQLFRVSADITSEKGTKKVKDRIADLVARCV